MIFFMPQHSPPSHKNTTPPLESSLEFLKIINEPHRLHILFLLKKDALCVCDIWTQLDIPQNLTSHHLKILKNFGLITSHKEGKKIIYTLQKEVIRKNSNTLSHLLLSHL